MFPNPKYDLIKRTQRFLKDRFTEPVSTKDRFDEKVTIYPCYRYAASRMDPYEEYRRPSRTHTSGSRQSKR